MRELLLLMAFAPYLHIFTLQQVSHYLHLVSLENFVTFFINLRVPCFCRLFLSFKMRHMKLRWNSSQFHRYLRFFISMSIIFTTELLKFLALFSTACFPEYNANPRWGEKGNAGMGDQVWFDGTYNELSFYTLCKNSQTLNHLYISSLEQSQRLPQHYRRGNKEGAKRAGHRSYTASHVFQTASTDWG